MHRWTSEDIQFYSQYPLVFLWQTCRLYISLRMSCLVIVAGRQQHFHLLHGMTRQTHADTSGDDIAEHECSTIMEKRERNSLVAVNQLPSELLSQIFLVWVTLWRNLRRMRRSEAIPSWTVILHVCHLWRQIARTSPLLWTTFAISDNSQPDVVEAMLHHSMQAPLHVTMTSIQSPPRSNSDPIQRVLDHLPRIRSLSYFTTAPGTYVLGKTAPILQSFTYNHVTIFNNTLEEETPFDSVDMPSLSRLELRHGPSRCMPWSSPLLKAHLTHLSLTSQDSTSRSLSTTMSDILHTLRTMPLLKRLDLRHVLPFPAGQLPALPSAVRLPRLRTLDLMGHASSIACLLRNVVYPPTVHLRVDCIDPIREVIHHLRPVLESKANRAAAPQLSCVFSEETQIRAWPMDLGVEFVSVGSRIVRHLSPDEPTIPSLYPLPTLTVTTGLLPRSEVASLLPHVHRILPPENVTVLYFSAPGGGTEAAGRLSRVWKRMVNVHTLSITQEERLLERELVVVQDALSALARVRSRGDKHHAVDNAAEADARPRQLLFPALRILQLHSVWMRPTPDTEAQESIVGLDLPRMLAARKAAGCQVKRLVLLKCVNIRKEDVALLEGLAEEVEWDGREILESQRRPR